MLHQPCIKKVVFLDFTEQHARTYNELAVTVRRNILMADWNDPSHVESILNPKQWKFRSTLIRNVRLSCCVAGHIKVTEAGHDIQETMDILVEQGLDRFSEEYIFIKIALQDGCSCFRYKMTLRFHSTHFPMCSNVVYIVDYFPFLGAKSGAVCLLLHHVGIFCVWTVLQWIARSVLFLVVGTCMKCSLLKH